MFTDGILLVRRDEEVAVTVPRLRGCITEKIMPPTSLIQLSSTPAMFGVARRRRRILSWAW